MVEELGPGAEATGIKGQHHVTDCAHTLGLTVSIVGDRVATCVPGGELCILHSIVQTKGTDLKAVARTPNGAFAEYVTAHAFSLISLPDSWTFEQGAQIGKASRQMSRTMYGLINVQT